MQQATPTELQSRNQKFQKIKKRQYGNWDVAQVVFNHIGTLISTI